MKQKENGHTSIERSVPIFYVEKETGKKYI